MATAAPSGTNQKQLKENLATYEAQLHQVEAALTNDPENEELLKLKTDLTEVLQLTQDLLQLAPETKKRERAQSAYDWKQGDPCRALWSDNAKYYNAVVDMVAEDGVTCTVTFDGYGTTEIVRLADLRPQGWEEEDNAGEAKRRREALAGKNSRQKREQMREYKKKKAQKKAARQQEIEELRESEKQRWKQFTSKSSRSRGNPLNSKQKRSIFAVPDSLTGKVGVGTCNVGGQPMTEYEVPKNYVRQ